MRMHGWTDALANWCTCLLSCCSLLSLFFPCPHNSNITTSSTTPRAASSEQAATHDTKAQAFSLAWCFFFSFFSLRLHFSVCLLFSLLPLPLFSSPSSPVSSVDVHGAVGRVLFSFLFSFFNRGEGGCVLVIVFIVGGKDGQEGIVKVFSWRWRGGVMLDSCPCPLPRLWSEEGEGERGGERAEQGPRSELVDGGRCVVTLVVLLVGMVVVVVDGLHDKGGRCVAHVVYSNLIPRLHDCTLVCRTGLCCGWEVGQCSGRDHVDFLPLHPPWSSPNYPIHSSIHLFHLIRTPPYSTMSTSAPPMHNKPRPRPGMDITLDQANAHRQA